MEIKPEHIYKRQITLSEIGLAGQQKFMNAKVLIIGCGGLGSLAATYLAASGIGHMHLVDFDTIDISNLHRQVFYTLKDVGKLKAKILGKHLRKIAPIVEISWSKKLINKSNIKETISDHDIILDCTDHLPTKYLINDACVIADKVLIYGSLYKFTGYMASFNVPINGVNTANLRDAFPEMPKNHVPNCAEIGTLNTIVGIIALQQANEVLKLVAGVGKLMVNRLLIYDSLDNIQHIIKLNQNFNKDQIQSIFEASSYTDVHEQQKDWLISATALKKMISKEKDLNIVSVIEDSNIPIPMVVDAKIPLSNFGALSSFVQKNMNLEKTLVLICQKGISSYIATEKLKAIYPQITILSLSNGIYNY